MNESFLLIFILDYNSFLCERRRKEMSTLNTIHDEALKYYSKVTKLVHYTSKIGPNVNGRYSKQHRLSSTIDLTNRFDLLNI